MNKITLHLYPDDYHLKYLGQLETGDQFIIDLNLIPAQDQTRDFICTYVFWANGALKNYFIEELGVRGSYNNKQVGVVIDKHLGELGTHTIAPIKFQPFRIDFAGTIFGFSVQGEKVNSEDVVDVLPGHTLMFYPPWEEGAYDT